MNISKYNSKDSEEVITLFTNVFTDSEGEEEGLLIGRLVRDLINTNSQEDLHGYVAKVGEKIIGCIFFSRLTFESNNIIAFILSPVAIQSDYQKQGIGQKLINNGLSALKERGVELVFTYGDPAFYSKVGFKSISEEIAKAPLILSYPDGWLCQSLIDSEIKPIEGKSHCVAALNNQQYW